MQFTRCHYGGGVGIALVVVACCRPSVANQTQHKAVLKKSFELITPRDTTTHAMLRAESVLIMSKSTSQYVVSCYSYYPLTYY